MKKGILAAFFIILALQSCRYKDPMSSRNGELSVHLTFPPALETELKKSAAMTIDRIHIIVLDDDKSIIDQDLEKSGSNFVGDFKLAAGDGYSLAADCYQNNVLIYQGSESNISIRANAVSVIQVKLSGVFINTGLSFNSLDFGSVTLGSSSDKTLRISNTGTAVFQVSSMTTTNAAFTIISSTSYNIAAGANQNVTIRFTPTSATSYNGTLKINNNSTESVKDVPLTGTGFEVVTETEIQWLYIPGGNFNMGDTFGDGQSDEKPVHSVTVSDFSLSKTQVTVSQYRAFCNASGRSMPNAPNWGWQDNNPVVNVSWHDAVDFCQWVGGRLPTEAEWEYAARSGGKSEKWAGTSDESKMGEYVWYTTNSGVASTHPVGTKKPNGLGLYDMSGNVWEWCSDWYIDNYYTISPSVNPQGPSFGSFRIARGGGWSSYGQRCRSSFRDFGDPGRHNDYIGFRIAKSEGALETGSVTDIDGNVYKTVKIGDQEWMAENLKVTRYRNGEVIPNITNASTWAGLTTGAYCNYNNDEGQVTTYGKLYNWYAVEDNRNLAPVGWHIPTDTEWKILEMALGMSQSNADLSQWRGTDEGGKLKEAGISHWISPNTSATNASGFSALPGGWRSWNGGMFLEMGENGFYWTYTKDSNIYAYYRYLSYLSSSINRRVTDKPNGFSVRCVKD